MKKIVFLLILIICFSSCNSSKGIVTKKSKSTKVSKIEKQESQEINSIESKSSTIEAIIDFAKQFEGVKYKYGGTTAKGMDCSGLVNTAFSSKSISLPRSTEDLALKGERIDVNTAQKGDLLFFATTKNNSNINHVGIITNIRPGFVEFIHATTSLGVIVSNLAERYWHSAFIEARRVL
jgi:cell wall-associated NlpC family hydrolase